MARPPSLSLSTLCRQQCRHILSPEHPHNHKQPSRPSLLSEPTFLFPEVSQAKLRRLIFLLTAARGSPHRPVQSPADSSLQTLPTQGTTCREGSKVRASLSSSVDQGQNGTFCRAPQGLCQWWWSQLSLLVPGHSPSASWNKGGTSNGNRK